MKGTKTKRTATKSIKRQIKDLRPKNERDIKAGRDPADGLPTGKR